MANVRNVISNVEAVIPDTGDANPSQVSRLPEVELLPSVAGSAVSVYKYGVLISSYSCHSHSFPLVVPRRDRTRVG